MGGRNRFFLFLFCLSGASFLVVYRSGHCPSGRYHGSVHQMCVALECCFLSIPPFPQSKPKVEPHPSIHLPPQQNTHSYVFSRMLKLRAKDADKVRSGLASLVV